MYDGIYIHGKIDELRRCITEDIIISPKNDPNIVNADSFICEPMAQNLDLHGKKAMSNLVQFLFPNIVDIPSSYSILKQKEKKLQ